MSFQFLHTKRSRLYKTIVSVVALGSLPYLQPNNALCEIPFGNPATSSSTAQSSQVEPTSPTRIPAPMQKFFNKVTEYFGTRYRSGGTTPAGFDCSGFVGFMYDKAFDMPLPRSSREMSVLGNKIGKQELRPGDLVFFHPSGKSKQINHVGIYIGNDTFVHSSSSKGITEDQLQESYFAKRFAGGIRLLNPNESFVLDNRNEALLKQKAAAALNEKPS